MLGEMETPPLLLSLSVLKKKERERVGLAGPKPTLTYSSSSLNLTLTDPLCSSSHLARASGWRSERERMNIKDDDGALPFCLFS